MINSCSLHCKPHVFEFGGLGAMVCAHGRSIPEQCSLVLRSFFCKVFEGTMSGKAVRRRARNAEKANVSLHKAAVSGKFY
jgi:hypothetical protein